MGNIRGYTYGTHEVADSPLNLSDLKLLMDTMLFTDEDRSYLRMAGDVLKDQIENVLDVWYNFVGSRPHLAAYFSKPDGQILPDYLAAVRKRFGQWILDTCYREYDQDWLNYQYEIGLRHTRIKKNRTDNVDAVPEISYRYVIAFIFPITATIKPFLTKKGHSEGDVEKMHTAWFKSVVLQVTLWSQPYVKEGQF